MKLLMKKLSRGLLLLVVLTVTESLKIGSFNVKSFGKAKMKNSVTVKYLVDIVNRYDVLMMQEIRDKSGESLKTLLHLLNVLEGESTYALIASEGLGGKRYKEQYAFIYRTDIGLKLMDSFQYSDPNYSFKRPPFCVLFRDPNLNNASIALIAIHTSPSNTCKEVTALADVHAAVQQRWHTDNILILGDLNAGCNYLRKGDFKNLNLRNNDKYHWLITDNADTTVRASTHCAFDRFILTGQQLYEMYVQGSAHVFKFDSVYGLNESMALQVSDHYPIEVEFEMTRHRNKERKRKPPG